MLFQNKLKVGPSKFNILRKRKCLILYINIKSNINYLLCDNSIDLVLCILNIFILKKFLDCFRLQPGQFSTAFCQLSNTRNHDTDVNEKTTVKLIPNMYFFLIFTVTPHILKISNKPRSLHTEQLVHFVDRLL